MLWLESEREKGTQRATNRKQKQKERNMKLHFISALVWLQYQHHGVDAIDWFGRSSGSEQKPRAAHRETELAYGYEVQDGGTSEYPGEAPVTGTMNYDAQVAPGKVFCMSMILLFLLVKD